MGQTAASGAGADADARPRRVTGRRVGGTLVLLGLVAGGIVLATRGPKDDSPSRAEVAAALEAAMAATAEDIASAPPLASLVYQTILPSVVVVQAQRAGAAAADEAKGIGSGVIANREGLILTARHVVADSASIRVTFADGTEVAAEIVSQQPENDIAVLRTERLPEVVVPAILGGGVNVGDDAFAVGHPLGLTMTLTAGVVSALDRAIPLEDGTKLEGLIQFDTAVNPGSSGGPLLNRNGQVVGIVTALANPSNQEFFTGIGFAVPIGTAGGAAGGPSQ